MMRRADDTIVWTEQAKDVSQSMPFGGHDIGGNVWVENDCIYFYLAQSGWFDENNSLLKAGRWCIRVDPCPFDRDFEQRLCLQTGQVTITARGFSMTLWVDVFSPCVHLEMVSQQPCHYQVEYQCWRFQNRVVDRCSYELFQCKEVFFYPHEDPVFYKDTVEADGQGLAFYHKNENPALSFEKEMRDQGLDSVKNGLYNPQKNRIMGGYMGFDGTVSLGECKGKYIDTDFLAYCYQTVVPQKRFQADIYLLVGQYEQLSLWKSDLQELFRRSVADLAAKQNRTRDWWRQYFAKSYIDVDPSHPESRAWALGRNYQLFRYMLGTNYFGTWPTKFNGGLFTFDPSVAGKSPWSNDLLQYTPDFRLWGSGSHTIQNQRLVYWPMLKSGDWDAMPAYFDFYLRILPTAKANVSMHLNAKGAFFPEQVGTYGLCCGCDNEWGNRTGLPVTQIKYHFSNSLETCLMIMDYWAYTGRDITKYLPIMEEVLLFYDTFYPENDSAGQMILYPANALESYHVVRNPIDGIAGLKCLLTRLLEQSAALGIPAHLSDRWAHMLERIPPLPLAVKDGKQILAYAETRSVRHNCELPQLYPVHPYGLYGIGKPDLELAQDTAKLAAESDEQLDYISWHPTGIQYACLGMKKEAMDFLYQKMGNGPFRFPAFWGPGHDWTPDHNWGGSGMLQMQEMLLHCDGEKIYLFAGWPKDMDVHFRLCAPNQTIVSCCLESGVITKLEVFPPQRREDLILC